MDNNPKREVLHDKLPRIKCILILMLCIYSCSLLENEKQVTSIVKTERFYSIMRPSILSDSAMSIVKNLFKKNSISLDNLKPYRMLENKRRHYVRCNQYYKYLALFTNEVVFSFDVDGKLFSQMGDIVKEFDMNLLPKVTMEEASNLFYQSLISDIDEKDSLQSYIQKGFNAELGIYDLNAGHSYVSKDFVLAWKITIANERDYLKGYIRADSLSLIYYTNGIIKG